jgi:UDP-N-acetylmuramoyl-tripeptide--D-alanyl-D-alanine ligase
MSLARDVRIITFGLGAGADVRAEDVALTESGSAFRLVTPGYTLQVELPLAGRHNIAHACAAAAVAWALGTPAAAIRQGLAAAKPVAGRLQALQGIAGATVFDDSYNANPASVVAAAEFLAARRGSGWLVLGDMGELGDDRLALHRAVGAAVKKAGITRLFASGALSRETVAAFGAGGRWFESVDALIGELARALQNRGDSRDINVLVKGSRATRMERVVQALMPEAARERKA